MTGKYPERSKLARLRDRPPDVAEWPSAPISSSARARRLLARGVGVEDGDDLLGVAAEQPELGGGEGGAERGDRLGEAVLVGHDAVDVALDEDARGCVSRIVVRARSSPYSVCPFT